MKRKSFPSVFLLILAIVFCYSCNNEFECLQRPDLNGLDQSKIDSDVASIKDYLDSLDADYIEDPSGLIYRINEEGEGERPTFCNNITMTYQGKNFRADSIFEDGVSRSFRIRELIPGLQIGISEMNRGADYRFYIPSELAYRDEGSSCDSDGNNCQIPPNTILEYRIRLNGISVQ
jgi:hypothetical protein